MIAGSLLYLAIITPLSYLNGTKPHPNKTLVFIHNFLMSAYSLYEFIGCVLVLGRNWAANGFSFSILVCDPEGKMLVDFDWWIYTFYLSKFYEWLDTIILIVVRGKPHMPLDDWQKVLHVFHHTVTPSIVWVAWRWQVSVAWTGPLTNSIVHVIMYAYYMLVDVVPAIRKIGVFITPIQLLQFTFCISLLFTELAYWHFWPESCNPDLAPAAWLSFTYLAFLSLFWVLWQQKLNLRKTARRDASKSAEPAAASPRVKAD